jgi:hypothetical protein
MRWEGYVARMGEVRNARRILRRKSDGMRQFGRRRFKWEAEY